ncbi:MAG: helix-turn-helix domain-containing protein [Nitrososphaerota archaeon]|nr:helix-turn-helix domain-containing protein [Nitrososphaerota archaeon]
MTRQISREALERAYGEEKDADVSRRMLLVLKVRCDGMKQSHAAEELRRDKSWATLWLRRFDEEGFEGLNTRPRSGRPPKVARETLASVRRRVSRWKGGCRVEEVRELIREESGTAYCERQVYRIVHGWGFRSVMPEKRFVNEASHEERMLFKKGPNGS